MYSIFKMLMAKKHGKLIEYYTSRGGDMLGSSRTLAVKKYNDEKAIVRYSDSPAHNIEPQKTEVLVPISIFDDIIKIYDKEKLYRLPFRPKSRIFALDAETTSYYFTFDDKKTTRGSSMQHLKRRDYDALEKVEKIVLQALQQGEPCNNCYLSKKD